MKSRFPIVAAVGVVLIWGVLLGANFRFLDLFADFKMEMPPITMLWIRATRFSGGAAVPAIVLLAAFLLIHRQLSGWYVALALCVAANLAGFALLMPLVALINNLSGGDDETPMPPTPSNNTFASAILAEPFLGLLIAAFVFNLVLSVTLLFKRPDFAR